MLCQVPGKRFMKIYLHEVDVLRDLPSWYTALFMWLIDSSDYDTGCGITTYAHLISALTPAQPSRGGPRHYVPDRNAITRALRALERARILLRDTERSMNGDGLFFELAPRMDQCAQGEVLTGGYDSPQKALEAAPVKASEPLAPKFRQGVLTTSSKGILIQKKSELSTGELSTEKPCKPTRFQLEVLRKLKLKGPPN